MTSVPLRLPRLTAVDDRLPSTSVAENPPSVISLKSHTKIEVSPGQETAGGVLRVTVTVASQVSAAPQASVAINCRTLAPATGVKVTFDPLKEPPLTTVEVRLPSGSAAEKPPIVMSLKSQAKIVVSFAHSATGGLLSVTVTVVWHESTLPQPSIAINLRTLAPTTGVKHIWLPLRVPPTAYTVSMSLSISVAEKPSRQIWLRSQTCRAVSATQVTTGGLPPQTAMVIGLYCGLLAGSETVC